jgi:hypothetical protein
VTPDAIIPQDPWPKYSEMDADRRLQLLRLKVDEARLRWDLPYAQAISAAVFNYEALARGGQGEPTLLEQEAAQLISDLDRFGVWGFERAGGYGHRLDEAGGYGHR